jgi:hypothetical protein
MTRDDGPATARNSLRWGRDQDHSPLVEALRKRY